MEDLIGFLIFLFIAFITTAASGGTKQRRPRGTPGRTGQPPLPRQSRAPRQTQGSRQAQSSQRAQKPRQAQASSSSTVPHRTVPQSNRAPQPVANQAQPRPAQAASAGPLGSSVRAERERFARESAAFAEAHGVAEGRQTGEGETAPIAAVAAMLADREGLEQAVLLSEVLGKPKALRRSK